MQARSAPTGPLSIDWGHPITRGLRFCALPGLSPHHDLVSHQRWDPAGSVAMTAAGATFCPSAGVTHSTNTGTIGSTGQWSMFTLTCGVSSGAGLARAYFQMDSGTRHHQWRIDNEITGIHRVIFFTSSGGNVQLFTAASVLDGRPHALVAVGTSGRYELWNNGVLEGRDTTAQYMATTTPNMTSDAVGSAWGPVVVAMWDRPLSPGECQLLGVEPFVLFRAPRRRLVNNPQTVITGTIAVTEAADDPAATGTEVMIGSIAVTEQADDPAATGTEVIAGTIAVTEHSDTSTASGLTGVTSHEEIRPQQMPRQRGAPAELVRVVDESVVRVRITGEASVKRRNGDDDAILML